MRNNNVIACKFQIVHIKLSQITTTEVYICRHPVAYLLCQSMAYLKCEWLAYFMQIRINATKIKNVKNLRTVSPLAMLLLNFIFELTHDCERRQCAANRLLKYCFNY